MDCHALPPGVLPDLETEPISPVSPALADGFFTLAITGGPSIKQTKVQILALLLPTVQRPG